MGSSGGVTLDAACPTLAGQITLAYGLTAQNVVGTEGICNGDAQSGVFAQDYRGVVQVTIWRNKGTPQQQRVQWITCADMGKVSGDTVALGLTLTISADDPQLSNGFPFVQINGHNWWPDGQYEFDTQFLTAPGVCLADAGTADTFCCAPGRRVIALAEAPFDPDAAAAISTDDSYCRLSGDLGATQNATLPFRGWVAYCYLP